MFKDLHHPLLQEQIQQEQIQQCTGYSPKERYYFKCTSYKEHFDKAIRRKEHFNVDSISL
jgi:hypothetical protein